jgi:hypothetical protein
MSGRHEGSDNLDFDSVIQQQGDECKVCSPCVFVFILLLISCSQRLYLEVEKCLIQNDRNWGKCQVQVKTWKSCFEGIEEKK